MRLKSANGEEHLIQQSVPITTNVMRLKSANGEEHLIQHYVIEFVSDKWQVVIF
jgi:hypothetical protein